jgi:hypothetical protein
MSSYCQGGKRAIVGHVYKLMQEISAFKAWHTTLAAETGKRAFQFFQ